MCAYVCVCIGSELPYDLPVSSFSLSPSSSTGEHALPFDPRDLGRPFHWAQVKQRDPTTHVCPSSMCFSGNHRSADATPTHAAQDRTYSQYVHSQATSYQLFQLCISGGVISRLRARFIARVSLLGQLALLNKRTLPLEDASKPSNWYLRASMCPSRRSKPSLELTFSLSALTFCDEYVCTG